MLELDLMVQVSADEWDYLHRRQVYLDAMLVRVMRERWRSCEWYTAAELAQLELPGLPVSREAISQKARSGKWVRRRALPYHRGAFQYHVTSLPNRAFDALISRMLDLPDIEADLLEQEDPIEPRPTAIPPSEVPVPENMAPAWVLPLMRLIRGEAEGDLATAWRELPHHVPAGVNVPPVEEAADILVRLGLAGQS